jgi:hypothetical protein
VAIPEIYELIACLLQMEIEHWVLSSRMVRVLEQDQQDEFILITHELEQCQDFTTMYLESNMGNSEIELNGLYLVNDKRI